MILKFKNNEKPIKKTYLIFRMEKMSHVMHKAFFWF